MKCSFCGSETNMTCRDKYRTLYNCCKVCKVTKGLSVNVIYKDQTEKEKKHGKL